METNKHYLERLSAPEFTEFLKDVLDALAEKAETEFAKYQSPGNQQIRKKAMALVQFREDLALTGDAALHELAQVAAPTLQ